MTAEEQTTHEVAKAGTSMGAYLSELTSRDVDVLDFGCGWGGETLWLASKVRSVVGVDVERSSLQQARRALSRSRVSNCEFRLMKDGCIPLRDASVDAVFSTDTFEHVMDLPLAFGEIARVLRPGGLLVTRFGPLFYSPYGYHMQWACRVPYAHLLFGLDAILALRRERTGHLLDVVDWQGTGLNGRRFADFKRAALGAKLELVRFNAVPVLGLTRLTRVPFVSDLFTFGVDCVARRPAVPAAAKPQATPIERTTPA
jgi:SAM-dependent methyltransferase